MLCLTEGQYQEDGLRNAAAGVVERRVSKCKLVSAATLLEHLLRRGLGPFH